MLEEGSQFHFIGSFNLFQPVLPVRSSNKLTFPLYASERAQFNAQLRQLRDPGPGDNIGMSLTEALHQAIEKELGREQRPAHHFITANLLCYRMR